MLKEMNEKNKRKVPEDAPISFVKPRWRDHVVSAEGELDRRYYELSALPELKNSLRSGDVWVPGSRRYRDFDDYLLPKADFDAMLGNGGPPVAVETDFGAYLEERKGRLHQALTEVGRLMRHGELEGVSLEKGTLKISRPKKDEPEGMDTVTRLVYSLVPRIKLTDLLVEVDSWCEFSENFTHLKTGDLGFPRWSGSS